MLISWIKSYKENGYTIVEKKRGSNTNAQEKNDRTTGVREQGTKEESLNSRKRIATSKEIIQAISELRPDKYLW